MPKVITKEIYQYACSKCSTVYDSEELAKECERVGQYMDRCCGSQPWMWYRLSYMNCNEVKSIFAKRVIIKQDSKSCLGAHINVHNYCSNDYFIVDNYKNWWLLEQMSILEAYDKYGLLVDPYFRMDGDVHHWYGTNSMPLDVAKQIDETYNLERNKMTLEYSKLSENDLISRLVEHTLPNDLPPDFSFVNFVNKNTSKQ